MDAIAGAAVAQTAPSVATQSAPWAEARADWIAGLAKAVSALPLRPGGEAAPSVIVLRSGGRLLLEAACRADRATTLVTEAALLASATPEADALEVTITGRRRLVAREAFDRRFANNRRGLVGIEIALDGETESVPPTRMIAQNRGFARVLERFCEARGLTVEEFWDRGGSVDRFEASVLHVDLRSGVVTPLHRGQPLVPAEAVGPETLSEMARGLGGWLVRNTDAEGRLPYKYWPSRGAESDADNALRRFMAAVWLGRWAEASGDPAARAAADRNLARSLADYYVEDGDLGLIEHDGKAKLGAAAFAAIAILESPRRADFARQLERLDAGILALWQADGAFRTFHRPAYRNDNQNFYPGEALVYWALRYRETRDPALLSRALTSIDHYRRAHRAKRNPAFVPWHTEACALFHDLTGRRDLRDWVFEMNDWLLGVQQRAVPSADLHGRFYDPRRKSFGPPHASSTAVYLEGLSEAFRLAQAAGDAVRALRYADAIWAGLRNLRQLQFRDAVDMAPYARRDRIAGAIRTEAYDNTVRVDNVQHALGAVLGLMAQPDFLATHGRAAVPFRRIEAGIDVAPLLAEIDAQPALWDVETGRQRRVRVQRETASIPLRRAARPRPEGVAAEDWDPSEETELAAEVPITLGWMEDAARRLGGTLGRAMVVALNPRGRVHRHIDHGAYYRDRDRYHLVLRSAGGSRAISDEQTAVMREGELWWLDNKRPHEAENPSDEPRIHLIFDVLPARRT